MNIYALIPLVATLAYIPLLVMMTGNRPWHRQQVLFITYLLAAMFWSLVDFLFRANFLPQHNFLLLQIILVFFTLTSIQLFWFSSTFLTQRLGFWLPFAYSSLVIVFVLIVLGYIPEGVISVGRELHPQYGSAIVFLAVPLLTLLARNLYLGFKRLRGLDDPILYNQIVSLVLALSVIGVFTLAGQLPWGREYPISHFGNLINAFILSYAVVRHRLLDIRVVLRRGLSFVTLLVGGILVYWVMLDIFHNVFNFQFDLTATAIATMVTVLIGISVYKLRNLLFITISRVFQGQSFDYRRRLSDFAGRIHHVFSLEGQGGELLELVIGAVGCRKAGLLFLGHGGDFVAQVVEPKTDNPLSGLVLRQDSPIVKYLREQRRTLTGENLAILPEFRSLWQNEKEEIGSDEIELFMPLVSRDHLIGVLVLDKKRSGRYTLEDFQLLQDITERVAVSMEKEYLHEQIRQREEELAIINRSSSILSSSLDIQTIYGSFIRELKKAVSVNWAAITLIEENDILFLALSSDIGSPWQVGERIPLKGSATEWVTAHRRPLVEPDLAQERRFFTGKYHLQQGVRSIVYLPLIVGDKVIGSLIVASTEPEAYSQRHVKLLEQLASQIAMPVENSRLYARTEEQARMDELTGLLNRRSLDEQITSEINRHSRYGGVFSIIIFDLDSFKLFNDKKGHLAGDELLAKVGRIVRNAIRSADQAFRYGGDEFAILLPQTGIEEAYQVAERVRAQIASRLKTGSLSITASLGLASWPADGVDLNEIVAAADAALYNAKRSGGNQSHRASGAMLISDSAARGDGGSEDSEILSTIYGLAATVDIRDHYTRSHSKKVNEYALALAKALKLGSQEISKISTCALLHDIGKVGISDEILAKPGKLTEEEWETVKVHPQLGATIVSHTRQLAPCVPGILYHHEWYDGSGYPAGLKGEEIPLEARILAIADAFAAMTSERPYSKALSRAEAVEELKRNAGTQFDPKLVDVFCSLIKAAPVAMAEDKIRR